MSWLSRFQRAKTPEPTPVQTTTIILHRNDSAIPLIHNLQGVWEGEALRGVLVSLVQEYYEPEVFESTCELLWRDGADTWGEEVDLVVNVTRP